MKQVLTIAGSDCSGGAGIQADLKTFAAHRVFGASVIVSVVAENTCRVIDIQDLSSDMIRHQLEAVFEDMRVEAVKIGMLSQVRCMEVVVSKLKQYKPSNIIIDPVMYAKNGCPLMNSNAMETLIREVIPLADVLTPNIPEAEEIAGMKIRSISDMEQAGKRIHQLGAKHILIKGGHAVGDAVDVLYNGTQYAHFRAERIQTRHTHGTGCTYSAAIAANLALGLQVCEAIGRAKQYVTTAIRHALSIGKGHGPIHHFYDLYKHG